MINLCQQSDSYNLSIYIGNHGEYGLGNLFISWDILLFLMVWFVDIVDNGFLLRNGILEIFSVLVLNYHQVVEVPKGVTVMA